MVDRDCPARTELVWDSRRALPAKLSWRSSERPVVQVQGPSRRDGRAGAATARPALAGAPALLLARSRTRDVLATALRTDIGRVKGASQW